jgi:predicted metal-binding membrane protein
MNAQNVMLLDRVSAVFPFIIAIVAITIGGWVITTWLRIKNGYPLDGAWGQALHPRTDKEAMERIKLLTNENATLRAELGSVKDRLETIERIVTDQPARLAREIDSLAIDKGGHA